MSSAPKSKSRSLIESTIEHAITPTASTSPSFARTNATTISPPGKVLEGVTLSIRKLGRFDGTRHQRVFLKPTMLLISEGENSRVSREQPPTMEHMMKHGT